MKTLHLLWMTCLLATSVITAQNNSEEAIKKSKATIDSIVSSEKETLKKKLSAVNELLKDKKITEELGLQIKEDLTATTEKNIKEKTAAEAELLAKLIREQVDSKATVNTLDTLNVNKAKDYLRAMQELEKILRRKEDEKPNTDRASHDINLYTAIGFHNLNSSNGFGDNRFKTAGSKSFELGFTSSFRLLKTNNLFHINYGVAWMHNGLKFKESEYFVRENDVTKSVPYTANKLNKSKLRTNYAIVPIDFEFDFTPPTKTKKGVTIYPTHESFRVGFGGYVGVLIDSSQKIRYDDGGTHKNVIREDLNISPWIYGLSAHLGYKSCVLYARYSLAPLFRNNPVNEYPFSIGIRFAD